MGGGETWRRESEVRPLSKRGPLSVHGRPLIRIIRFRPTLGATFIRRPCARKNASIAGGPGIYECRGHMLVERPFSWFSLFFLLPPPRLPIAKFLQKLSARITVAICVIGHQSYELLPIDRCWHSEERNWKWSRNFFAICQKNYYRLRPMVPWKSFTFAMSRIQCKKEKFLNCRIHSFMTTMDKLFFPPCATVCIDSIPVIITAKLSVIIDTIVAIDVFPSPLWASLISWARLKRVVHIYVLGCTWKWRVLLPTCTKLFSEKDVYTEDWPTSRVSATSEQDRIAIRDLVCSSCSESVALLVLHSIRYVIYTRAEFTQFSRTLVWCFVSSLPCRMSIGGFLLARWLNLS